MNCDFFPFEGKPSCHIKEAGPASFYVFRRVRDIRYQNTAMHENVTLNPNPHAGGINKSRVVSGDVLWA